MISWQLQKENAKLRWKLAYALEQTLGRALENEILRDSWIGEVPPPASVMYPQIGMGFPPMNLGYNDILHPQPRRPAQRALVRRLPRTEVSHYRHLRTPPPEQLPTSLVKLPEEIQPFIYEELLNARFLGTAEGAMQGCTLYNSFLAFFRTCKHAYPICKTILYEDNTFFAVFATVSKSKHKQHAIVSPLTRTWHLQRSYMANNYVDPELLDRLSKVINWKLYLRPDDILPKLSRVISFCHALIQWDRLEKKCRLSIEILLEPKGVNRSAFEYQTQISKVLMPFSCLRNIKSFTVRLAKEEEVEVFPRDHRLQRFKSSPRYMKESKTALGRCLNSSGIVPLCQGKTPRTLFVKLWLNLLRYCQAFEMDIYLKDRMAFNADSQLEFNPDGTKFPDSDFVKLDRDTQKSRNRFLKRFCTDGERVGALEEARAYVTTSDFVRFTAAITELRDGLEEHQLAISQARGSHA